MPPRRRGTTGKKGGKEAWMDDDVDAANEVADARFAKVDKSYIGLVGSDDDDDDEDEDDEEALMDVTDEDDDDDDDDDEDSEEDDDSEDDDDDGERDDDNDDDAYSDSEEAALSKAMKAQKKRLDGKVRREQVMSEDESESEDADEGFGIRGKKKTDFYGDDDVDHEGLSDEEDRVEEEKEARRMRKLMAQEMRAEDFGVDSEDEEEATLGAKAADLRRGDGKSKSASRGGVEIETLTAEERDERLAAEDGAAAANDAPELMALTKELTSTLSAIEASVEPLVNAARDGAFATAEGISYLDTKYLLMLSYCSSIVFYLLLKAEGRSVKDHPVIERLVEIRLYLEKLRPIDKKLQYQIDKLLKLANATERATATKDEDDDPLRFGPNPGALVSKTGEDEEGGDGMYRPPKMLPTSMDFESGGKDAKELRRNKEQRRRAGRSQLIKELAREVGEAPEEVGLGDEDMVQSAFAKREMARMEARARVEEDLFTRVPLSKQERRRQKASTRNVNSLAAVGDFGDDVADLVERTAELDEGSRKRRLVDTVAEGFKSAKRDIVSGEQDVPLRDTLGERRTKYERGVARSMQRAQQMEMDDYDDEARPSIAEDPEYDNAATLRDRKRQAKEEKYARGPGTIAVPEEDVSGKREIGHTIMNNRGLTPHRSKETKNPRVRLRGKHARAVTRRKGAVRDVKEGSTAYGGELTGVKTSVVKSRKF